MILVLSVFLEGTDYATCYDVLLLQKNLEKHLEKYHGNTPLVSKSRKSSFVSGGKSIQLSHASTGYLLCPRV